jgi:hypothetical protein
MHGVIVGSGAANKTKRTFERIHRSASHYRICPEVRRKSPDFSLSSFASLSSLSRKWALSGSESSSRFHG